MLIYCCQNKKIIRRTEKQVSWQNQRRNNKFRKQLSLKNALDQKQAQEQYIRFWPRVGEFCAFYFKRLGIPRRLAITIVSQSLDNMLSIYEVDDKKTKFSNLGGGRNIRSQKARNNDQRKMISSRESNISSNQLKKKSRIKRQNIFKQIMGILFMAAKSETDRKQLLFFLDQASHTQGAANMIQKRRSHCQNDGATGAILAKANRIINNFEPGRLRQTPSVYELVDFYLESEGELIQNKDLIHEYKLQKFRKQSFCLQNQKKNQQDFKWLERYRNYIIISKHLQTLDQFRKQQLNLLLSINQQQDSNKYDLSQGQIYFNYLHQQANALWKFVESLLNMNFYDILKKKIQLNGRNLSKWNFDKVISGIQEVFIKGQIDSFRQRDKKSQSNSSHLSSNTHFKGRKDSSFSSMQRRSSTFSSFKIYQEQEQEKQIEGAKINKKSFSMNSDISFDEVKSFQSRDYDDHLGAFERSYQQKSQPAKSKDSTFADLNAPFSSDEEANDEWD